MQPMDTASPALQRLAVAYLTVPAVGWEPIGTDPASADSVIAVRLYFNRLDTGTLTSMTITYGELRAFEAGD
jgi:hypothetical protein